MAFYNFPKPPMNPNASDQEAIAAAYPTAPAWAGGTNPKTYNPIDPRTGKPWAAGPSDPFGVGPTAPDTTSRAQQLAYGGQAGGRQLYGVGQGIDPATGKPFSAETGDISTNVGRLAAEAQAPIESGFYQQSHDVASYLARQGLSASPGINIGASQQLASNKEALEGQARLKAIDLAQASATQGILNDLSAQQMTLQPDMSLFMQQQAINAQLQMMEEQMKSQMFSGLGQGLGSLAGMAISKIGGPGSSLVPGAGGAAA